MTRTVDTRGLLALLSDDRQKIANAYKEVEQIQAEYQGSYTRFKADHDKLLDSLVEQFESNLQAVPADLQGLIRARVPVEQDAIEKRRAELEGTLIPNQQAQADGLIAKAQQEQADLQTINPRLNQLEEGFKQDVGKLQKQLADLNAEVAERSRGLGSLLHGGELRKLDQQRHEVLGRLDAHSKKLYDVRKEWQDWLASTNKDEADLRTQWAAATAQLAALKAEQDQLVSEGDRLPQRRAIRYVLDNLKTPPPLTGSTLDESLKQMVRLNNQTDDFQAALGSVAGILGIAKGVDEGLQRLTESVNALANEQAQHSQYLSPLKFSLPDNVDGFGAVWNDLIAKTKDEQKLADHPADFYAAVKPFLEDRLTSKQIGAFFDALGASIKHATRSWRSG